MSVFFKRRSEYSQQIKKISNYALGSIVYLPINEENVPFIVVRQVVTDTQLYGEDCLGTWLMSKYYYTRLPWSATGDIGIIYPDSDIHNYLNNDFFNLLSPAAQAAVQTVKIPYQAAFNSAKINCLENGCESKVFLPACAELNDAFSVKDGNYFGFDCRATSYPPSSSLYNSGYFLRTINQADFYGVYFITSDGAYSVEEGMGERGIRPVLVLNYETKFDARNNTLKEE